MSNNGKQLEALVAFVEKAFVPEGFIVTTNDRVFNDEGIQIAEFDVLVQGKVGTTEFQWLIECRDRPSSGAAPTSWIEQLVGRRARFNLNKVTAVSTTGFAANAYEFAQSQGIELREVQALTPDDFSDWLELKFITNTVRHTSLSRIYFALEPETPQELHDALAIKLAGLTGDEAVLRSTSTREMVSPARAFSSAVSNNRDLFNGLEVNGEAKTITLVGMYQDHDYFEMETCAGLVPIKEIEFTGEIRLQEFQLPIVYTGEYRDAKTGDPISQVVTYAPQSIMGQKFSTELHKLAETGETRIVLRKV